MTDVSARTTMKGTANCSKHCDLQNSVNQWCFERVRCFWDIPESISASVLLPVIPRTLRVCEPPRVKLQQCMLALTSSGISSGNSTQQGKSANAVC